MALTKELLQGSIQINELGIVFVRAITRISEDGEFLVDKNHRSTIAPGDDYSGFPNKIRQVCDIFHTPAAIAAYQAQFGPQEG